VHLVLDHVAELKHIDDAYGGRLVKAVACAAVVEVGLAETWQTGLVGPFVKVVERSAVEDRCREFLAQLAAGPSEYGLEDLSEVHTRGHAQRVKHDIDRSAVGEERHVFLTYHAGYDTLVAVAAGHLIAYADLTFFSDIYLGHLDDSRGKLIADGDVKFLTAQLTVDFL